MGFTGVLTIALGWLCLAFVLTRVAGLPRLSRRQLRWVFPVLTATFLVASAAAIRQLYGYTADDAYLIARYAAQLVELGQPVFNPGEPVNAITTPLTMVEMAVLYLVSPEHLMRLYKLLCLALYVIGLGIVFLELRSAAAACAFAALVALSPFHSLWLVGGLETPLLGFLLLVLTILVLRERNQPRAPLASHRTALWAALLASLAFATRFDSVLFTAPVLLYLIWRQRRLRDAVAVAATAALLPAALLTFNVLFYGDALPTSFYLKTRTALNWQSFVYVLEFFLYSGLFLFFVFVGITKRNTAGDVGLLERLRNDPGPALWAGLFLFCVPYATFTSTSHMMYGFRAFVPYLAVMAYLLSRHVADRARQRSDNTGAYLEGLLLTVVIVALVQLGSTLIMPRPSLNAARVGEFRSYWDIPTYLEELESAAGAVEQSWRASGGGAGLRVYSPNEGIAGYALRDASVHGRLTGYRRRCPVKLTDYALSSHYAIVEEPFVGLHLRDVDLSDWELVYQGRQFSRGHSARQRSRVLAYRNPHPEQRDFAYGVDDPCPGDDPGGRASREGG